MANSLLTRGSLPVERERLVPSLSLEVIVALVEGRRIGDEHAEGVQERKQGKSKVQGAMLPVAVRGTSDVYEESARQATNTAGEADLSAVVTRAVPGHVQRLKGSKEVGTSRGNSQAAQSSDDLAGVGFGQLEITEKTAVATTNGLSVDRRADGLRTTDSGTHGDSNSAAAVAAAAVAVEGYVPQLTPALAQPLSSIQASQTAVASQPSDAASRTAINGSSARPTASPQSDPHAGRAQEQRTAHRDHAVPSELFSAVVEGTRRQVDLFGGGEAEEWEREDRKTLSETQRVVSDREGEESRQAGEEARTAGGGPVERDGGTIVKAQRVTWAEGVVDPPSPAEWSRIKQEKERMKLRRKLLALFLVAGDGWCSLRISV